MRFGKWKVSGCHCSLRVGVRYEALLQLVCIVVHLLDYLVWAAASLQLLHLLLDLLSHPSVSPSPGRSMCATLWWRLSFPADHHVVIVGDSERQIWVLFFAQNLQFVLVISHCPFLCSFTSNYWPREVQYVQALTRLRAKTCRILH